MAIVKEKTGQGAKVLPCGTKMNETNTPTNEVVVRQRNQIV